MVEQPREADALGLGDEAQEFAVAVEGPRSAAGDQFERRLVVA